MFSQCKQDPADDIRSELQDLLNQAMKTPLDTSIFSRMVVLLEAVRESGSEAAPNGPWAPYVQLLDDEFGEAGPLTETGPHDCSTATEPDNTCMRFPRRGSLGLQVRESAERRVAALLAEIQIYFKYQLFDRAHRAVVEANSIALAATGEVGRFVDNGDDLEVSERQISLILRLLSLAETIEDTQLVTLHLAGNSAFSFVVHQRKICAGYGLEGQTEVAVVRAFVQNSQMAASKPFRIAQTKVADPGKVLMLEPFELYRQVCAELFVTTPLTQSAMTQFQKETSFGAEFRILPKHTPVLVRSTEKLKLHDLQILAETADMFTSSGNRLTPGIPVGFVILLDGIFWAAQVDDGTVALTRFEMKHLGRVSNWMNQLPLSGGTGSG